MVDFKNAEELLSICSQSGQKISAVMKQRECDLGEITMEQACGRMQTALVIMREAAMTLWRNP